MRERTTAAGALPRGERASDIRISAAAMYVGRAARPRRCTHASVSILRMASRPAPGSFVWANKNPSQGERLCANSAAPRVAGKI